ncbi:DUF2849 domain-containing protein [Sphingomonas sp. CGMCC 1.13654]|uniref:DUF2849 domain-containing protein n=1 Tax=Sphingomonas chungangi TaxID=2683589 RepID=A0A838L3B2_9SPHN|nr:DUF2849 domain-containing protein [Sphingomonas chungangi]MVW56632.1 DUF2849 domain-containing protein [Sphingomonas chungangi]
MKIATGNDLATGDVVWWDGEGWSRHVEEAVDVGDHGAALIAREDAARRVNAAYVIDAEATPQGPRPAHIKDRIRARGPTVRADLNIAPADTAAGSWVI